MGNDRESGQVTNEVTANAKLNLTLAVLGLRDDAYHELEALTVNISDPHDVVTVTTTSTETVELSVSGNSDDVPIDDSNLAVRAARAVLPPGVGARIELRKGVPTGAGLGGGSADAAAVLRVLGDLLDLDSQLVAMAAREIGSDVPFCLSGVPAWMKGRGEVIEPVDVRGSFFVLIAKPPFSLHTPWVYRAWDDLGGPTSVREVAAPSAVAHLVEVAKNDLEAAAEHVEPRLRPFREAIEISARAPSVLAGSGSSYWIPFDDQEEAERARANVGELPGVHVWLGAVCL